MKCGLSLEPIFAAKTLLEVILPCLALTPRKPGTTRMWRIHTLTLHLRSVLLQCKRNRICNLYHSCEMSLWNAVTQTSCSQLRRKFRTQYSLFLVWVSTHLHEDVDHKALWPAFLERGSPACGRRWSWVSVQRCS